MRFLTACFILVCTFVAGGESVKADAVGDLVGLYHKIALSSEHERCDTLLRQALKSAKLKDGVFEEVALVEASNLLRDERCLDKWSSLASKELPRNPVTVSGRWEDEFLYIRIFDFWDATGALTEVLKSVPSVDALKHIIIDFRGNSGGSIDDMRDLLNKYFSPEAGLKFMHIEATDYPAFQTTDRRGLLAGRNLTILVDDATASAAEWMTAILRYEWYPQTSRVLGVTTFGKAVIQCRRPDSKTATAIRVTCGEWKIGTTVVNGRGITPDSPLTLGACDGEKDCVKQLFARR